MKLNSPGIRIDDEVVVLCIKKNVSLWTFLKRTENKLHILKYFKLKPYYSQYVLYRQNTYFQYYINNFIQIKYLSPYIYILHFLDIKIKYLRMKIENEMNCAIFPFHIVNLKSKNPLWQKNWIQILF